MFTYSVSDELIAAILDKKFVVESASVKKDELTVRLLNTITDTVMIVKFSNPSFSNENFDTHGSYVEDISLYGYRKVFKTQYFNGCMLALADGKGNKTTIRGVRK